VLVSAACKASAGSASVAALAALVALAVLVVPSASGSKEGAISTAATSHGMDGGRAEYVDGGLFAHVEPFRAAVTAGKEAEATGGCARGCGDIVDPIVGGGGTSAAARPAAGN
jgi:hypothetical protein